MFHIHWRSGCGENKYSGPYESELAAYDEATKNKKLERFSILKRSVDIHATIEYHRTPIMSAPAK